MREGGKGDRTYIRGIIDRTINSTARQVEGQGRRGRKVAESTEFTCKSNNDGRSAKLLPWTKKGEKKKTTNRGQKSFGGRGEKKGGMILRCRRLLKNRRLDEGEKGEVGCIAPGERGGKAINKGLHLTNLPEK